MQLSSGQPMNRPPQATDEPCKRFCARWVCSLFPTPDIFGPRNSGGVGVLAANSAALFRLTLLSSEEMDKLQRRFNKWLGLKLKEKQGPPTCWSEQDAMTVLQGERLLLVYAWVHREVDRRIGTDHIYDPLGAAGLWSFSKLRRMQQLSLVQHVHHRYTQQRMYDEQAGMIMNRIMES